MLEIERVRKRYGARWVLDNVFLSVEPEKILCVLGPTGCGKTTLLRTIAGFESIETGAVRIDGRTVTSPDELLVPPRLRKLSMVFQDAALWPHMTVNEHIRFVLNGAYKNRSSEQILKTVGFHTLADRYPHQLSGGQKQQLALARGFASYPSYLLLDEPFSNLDHLCKQELTALIRMLKGACHTGIIYVTHTLDEAMDLAVSLAIMKAGKIEQFGKKEAVLQNPATDFVRRFLCL